MEHLFDKLQAYAREEIYPCHMPGHKRQGWGKLPKELYQLDITEIEGFDNLHQPEGILLNLQKKAAEIYGAEESFYLVNGSTCGILSAVSCALPRGGHLLMARNCHRSAYHAAYLRDLKPSYLYPPCLEEYEVFDAVTPLQVRKALEREPHIGAVLIVSPTYEGRIADVGAVAEIAHDKGIPLIVDEAHGAHLGLRRGDPLNSCQLGADLVVHSVHKTLPSLTQTALLHVNGSLVDRERLRRFLHIYQSSSPSYLLMAGIDNALAYVEKDGDRAMDRFQKHMKETRKALRRCRHLKFLPEDGRQDPGKLLISVKGTNLTGKQLYDILLQEYGLQMEMASGSYALAMFTLNDREEAFRRVTEALLEIDGRLREGTENFFRWKEEIFRSCPDAISLGTAWDRNTELVPLEGSVGRHGGDFICPYPPGSPLVVPGEVITEEMCRLVRKYIEEGLSVQGVVLKDEIFVRVIMP